MVCEPSKGGWTEPQLVLLTSNHQMKKAGRGFRAGGTSSGYIPDMADDALVLAVFPRLAFPEVLTSGPRISAAPAAGCRWPC